MNLVSASKVVSEDVLNKRQRYAELVDIIAPKIRNKFSGYYGADIIEDTIKSLIRQTLEWNERWQSK